MVHARDEQPVGPLASATESPGEGGGTTPEAATAVVEPRTDDEKARRRAESVERAALMARLPPEVKMRVATREITLPQALADAGLEIPEWLRTGALYGFAMGSALVWVASMVGEWLVLAAAAGLSEELLFRGALQPIFGIVPTSLIFAVSHVQYGLSPATLTVFLLSVILGIVFAFIIVRSVTRPISFSASVVAAVCSRVLTFTWYLMSVTEAVTVTAETTTASLTSPTVGANYDAREISTLPTGSVRVRPTADFTPPDSNW